MWFPQPLQVTLVQVSQIAGLHMMRLLLLLAEKTGQESWLLGIVCVSLALLGLRDTAHYLVYVLAAAAPGGFAALAAGYFLTHFGSLLFWCSRVFECSRFLKF